MEYVIRLPTLGMQMKHGTVVEWLVDVGEDVSEGEPIVAIESEKAATELEAEENGVLRRRYVEAGREVEPGTALAVIADAGADLTDIEPSARSGDDESTEGDSDGPTDETGTTDPQTMPATASGNPAGESGDLSSSGSERNVKASPRAKKRASELSVNLATVGGTGPEGAIGVSDIERAAGSAGMPPIATERELTETRRRIADRLGRSVREAVHVTEHVRIDAEALLAAAEAADEVIESAISVSDLLLVAVSLTLNEHLSFNATFEDGVYRIYKHPHICVAVDTKEGVVAPILRNISDASLADVAQRRSELVDRTCSGTYTADDLTGGTFTVSNLGTFDVDTFTPIINPPQVAILGVGSPRSEATQTDDGVEFHSHLSLSLSFDHRVVDGADGARFLQTLRTYLEAPGSLLPEDAGVDVDPTV